MLVKGVLAAPLLALLTACSGAETVAPPPPPVPPPPPAVSSAVEKGLTPLLSPDQLQAAIPMGRPDPFMTPRLEGSTPRAARARPLELPADFQLNGVVATPAEALAFVQRGALTATVRVGETAALSSDSPIPPGWTVTAIDPSLCAITLRQGKARQIEFCPRQLF